MNRIWYVQQDLFTVGERCSQFILYLFPSKYPPPYTEINWQTHFSHYVSSVLHRSMFDIAIVISAMVLLQRYKEQDLNRNEYEENIFGLFLASYITAAVAMGHVSVTSEFWCYIADGMFSKEEVAELVDNFCELLNWDIRIEEAVFVRFVSILHDNAGQCDDENTTFKPPPCYKDSHLDIRIIERHVEPSRRSMRGLISVPDSNLGEFTRPAQLPTSRLLLFTKLRKRLSSIFSNDSMFS